MRAWLLVPLLACRAADPPPPTPTSSERRPFDQSSGATTRRLDPAAAVAISLPPSVGAPPTPDVWTLGPVAAEPDASDGRSLYWFELPFQIDGDDARFRPTGMTVRVDGVEVPFDVSPIAPGHAGWRVKDGALMWVEVGGPPERSVELRWPDAAARSRRLDPGASGLSAADYVRYTHTSDDVTRPGLLLPAPSSIRFEVDVPARARFEAVVDLVVPAMADRRSDGATVALGVVEGDTVRELRRKTVRPVEGSLFPGALRPPAGASPWAVDLSDFAGQRVTLDLSTSDADPTLDYVFVGAPAVVGAAETAPRRVVVVAVDTLRPDHLGAYGYERATSDDIDAFAARSVVFERAWAPAPRTRPSFRSAFTGRGALDAVGAANVAESFAAAGFATAGFAANIHLNPRFGFDRGFDTWHLDPTARADVQVDRALTWLRDHAHRDAFVFVHLMDPHLFYEPPAPWDTTFVTDPDPTLPVQFNRWDTLDWAAAGALDPRRQAHISALYDGEIGYTSDQVGRLVAGLDALGDNNVVVFHTDHGEELWDHGSFEHNHALWDEVVRVAMIMRYPPGDVGGVRVSEPVALWDIAPTLLDVAGVAPLGPFDGRSLAPLARGADPGGWDRPLPLGHLMYDLEQWGVVVGSHKYVLTHATGEERVYDLAADPRETTNIADRVDLGPLRAALSEAHRTPVGPGWRIEVAIGGPDTLEIALPAAALDAGVMDPESERPTRANLEWGEEAPIDPTDVGRVTLSDDRRSLRFEPGPIGAGRLWVRFDTPTPPASTCRRRGVELRGYAANEAWRCRGDAETVRIVAGTVLVPPIGEVARMTSVAADASDLDLLRSLGYVGEHGAAPSSTARP
jgi:arylsulfatase A-like enzyme